MSYEQLAAAVDALVSENTELGNQVREAIDGIGDMGELARQWAENPENTPVLANKFSALHWAAKAKVHSDQVESVMSSAVKVEADNRVIKVPADFPTVQAAIDSILNTRGVRQKYITIQLQTGYVIAHGWRVEDVDLSHVRITSVDPVVKVSNNLVPVGTGDLPAGIARSPDILYLGINAKMPELRCLIDASGAKLAMGVAAVEGSYINVRPGCGVKNLSHTWGEHGTALYVAAGSHCHGHGSIWTGSGLNGCQITLASSADMQFADFSSGARTGIDVSRGSIVNVVSAIARDCDRAIDVRRSWIAALGADLSNARVAHIWCRAGSHAIISDAILGGARPGLGKILCTDGSSVTAFNAVGDNSSPLNDNDSGLGGFNFQTRDGIILYNNAPEKSSVAVTRSTRLVALNGNEIEVPATSWHIISSLSGPQNIQGGTIHGVSLGLRITVDDQVILEDTGLCNSQNSAGQTLSVLTLPNISSSQSLLIEVYNRSSTARRIGWKIYRRTAI